MGGLQYREEFFSGTVSIGTFSFSPTSMLLVDGNIQLTGSIKDPKWIDFNPTTASSSTGRVWFDTNEESLSYYPDVNQDVIVRTGQQLYLRVNNTTGSSIPKGSVVKISSASSGLPNVSLATADHLSSPNNRIVGLAADRIPVSSVGLVLVNGLLDGLNLSAYSVGDLLYLSDVTPGAYILASNLAITAITNEIGYVIDNGSSTGKIYVNVNNENRNLTLTDIERNILEGNVISTGVYTFSPGIQKVSSASFSVSEAKGWVVKNTGSYSILPDVTNVLFAGATGLSSPYLSTADQTYVLINASASLFYLNTFPTPQQRRENLFLGKIVHPDRTTILSVNQTVDFDVSPMSALRDLWTPLKLVNQGVVPSFHQVGSMSFNTSSGTLWGNGIGWVTNELNPNSVSISAKNPVTFQYRTQLVGSTGSDVTNINPTIWDNAGVLTTVANPASQATNQRIYLYPTGIVRVQYGQYEYQNLAAAVSAQQTEQFTENPNARDNGILIGILSVIKGCTDLSDTTKAQFNFVSKFGEVLGGSGGLSTTTLQQAYDNSTQPEIVTNATLGAVTFKRGSSLPTDNVIEVQDAAGGITFSVTGEGHTTTNTLTISNISATTSATHYVVVNNSGDTFYQTVTPGSSGTSGVSGSSGTSGVSGSSGTSGISGSSGTSGISGSSGTSGVSGSSGTSGVSGSSGTSGVSGSSGTSGISGSSGTSGISGSSGTSGVSGSSGTSGVSGSSGTSGLSGVNGLNGSSGTSGTSFGATGTTNYVPFWSSSTTLSSTSSIYDDGNYVGIGTVSSASYSLVIKGDVNIDGKLFALSKSFDIVHPLDSTKRLVYGSLEGPEYGVYQRGRLQNSNIISLPTYWSKLVDINTVTVNLTPVGSYQNLFVQSIGDNSITISSYNSELIDCYYIVYAERKDISKIIVEK